MGFILFSFVHWLQIKYLMSSVWLVSASFYLKIMGCKVLVRNWNYICFWVLQLTGAVLVYAQADQKGGQIRSTAGLSYLEVSLSKQLCERKEAKMWLYSTMCVGFLLSNFFAVGNNNGKNKEATWFFKQELDKGLLPFGVLLCKIRLLHIYI